MAFTAKYSDLATLVNNSIFQSRVTGAVANYAKYLVGQNNTTLLQANWARAALADPLQYAAQVYWQTAIDPAFSGQSTTPIDPNSITDAQMDTVVQTAINNSLLKY